MEETEKAAASVYHGARDVPAAASSLLRKLNEELHITLPLLGQDQSLLPNREFFGSVGLPVTCPPLTSCLEESPRSSLSRSDAPKIEARERNSVRLWPCDECGKVFKKERAMYGHKRSHSVRNRKVSKKAVVIPEQKAASAMCQEFDTECRDSRVRRRSWKTQSVTDCDIGAERTLLSESSSCSGKKGGWDVRLDVNISVEELASFLVDLSQSDGKTHICEKCNQSFPSEKTLREHVFSQSVERKDELVAGLKPPTELKRKNEVVALKPSTELKRNNEVMADLKLSTGHLKSGEKKPKRAKKEPEIKSHICRECGREFTTGHQLGGHMRAHYDPAEPKRKAGGGMDG